MGRPIFILNAPPRVGKDTICNEVQGRIFAIDTCFKLPMYQIAANALGMSLPGFMDQYETEGWKDTYEISPGKTVRDLMIGISESLIKPLFGKDYFGIRLTDYIFDREYGDDQLTWIIPDGGFTEEVEPLLHAYGKRVIIIQLEREGHRDFGTDSRNWINIPGVETYRFDTTGGNNEVIDFICSF